MQIISIHGKLKVIEDNSPSFSVLNLHNIIYAMRRMHSETQDNLKMTFVTLLHKPIFQFQNVRNVKMYKIQSIQKMFTKKENIGNHIVF